ncbi:MAG: hypothetical protein HUU01_21690 [Saprospiraceae bacterium]|nr:hypothetical protein [Saprospiraceae bacterium]
MKNYLWGGRNLEKVGRVLPSEGVVAESWEIAGHEDGTSVVKNGRFASLPVIPKRGADSFRRRAFLFVKI